MSVLKKYIKLMIRRKTMNTTFIEEGQTPKNPIKFDRT